MQQFALRIETDDLAARAKAGIDRDDGARAEGCGEQQLAQVGSEHVDRGLVRPGFELGANLGLELSGEQPVPRVIARQLHVGSPYGWLSLDGERAQKRARFIAVGCDVVREKTFALPAQNGEQAMRRNARHGLAEIVVIGELAVRLPLAARGLRADLTARPREIAQGRAPRGVLHDALGHDVARSGERVVRGLDAFFRVHEFRGDGFG